MGRAGPPGRVPLEALILAFAHSRAKSLVGTDALRSVLSGQYRQLQRDGNFDLEPVWELLAQQPGFDPDQVRPALCRFKTWEGHLGVSILMPAAMTGLDEGERMTLAAMVFVPAQELSRVLQGKQVPSEVPGPSASAPEPEARPPAPRSDKVAPAVTVAVAAREPLLRRLTRGQRRFLEIAAIILAVIGFAVAGVQLQRGCSTPAWDQIGTRFAGEIPLRAAERQGPEVSGSLQDSRWLGLAAPVRTAHLKRALEALPRDVQVFFVRDGDGQVRAIARWFGQPRQISITLQ
jgi:hypothetical protein